MPDYIKILARMEQDAKSLPESWQDRLLDSILSRKKWANIIREYPTLKDQHGSEEACRKLAKKYNYSVKTIQYIVYQRKPSQKLGTK